MRKYNYSNKYSIRMSLIKIRLKLKVIKILNIRTRQNY
jgi:hypothetical protein